MIKIGVFGAYRGKTMIDVLVHYREAQLVAVCDRYQPALDKIRKATKEAGMDVALYTDFDDFIKHDMDAVVLANYATEHAPFAVRCLKAGKHVLSECLPCETMAQAVELIETVEETGLIYAYAENYCYRYDTFEMWRRYETGEYGEIQYAECEYVHDCACCWPQITYGDKNHWRNHMHPNFYCTHSIGPILAMTGRRPVKVVGYEIPKSEADIMATGRVSGSGLEMVTLDNGAVVKSLHGDLKREPPRNYYLAYCSKGLMEGNSDQEGTYKAYKEDDGKFCVGSWETYEPERHVAPELSKKIATHGGADFFPTYLFIQKMLGKPDGKWSLDVYQAVNMGICGILAWRSAVNGNVPIEVPDLSKKEERDKYRNDHACTNPKIAGDQLMPETTFEIQEVSDDVYEHVRSLWEQGLDSNGNVDVAYANL